MDPPDDVSNRVMDWGPGDYDRFTYLLGMIEEQADATTCRDLEWLGERLGVGGGLTFMYGNVKITIAATDGERHG